MIHEEEISELKGKIDKLEYKIKVTNLNLIRLSVLIQNHILPKDPTPRSTQADVDKGKDELLAIIRDTVYQLDLDIPGKSETK